MIPKQRAVHIAAVILLTLSAGAATVNAAPATPKFVQAMLRSGPLAWYRLQAPHGSSVVGRSNYVSQGTVTAVAPGASIVGIKQNQCLRLDGSTGWIGTTRSGGINGAGSMMAWVNLAELPSQAGHILYVAGESQVGNDFDVQFEQDNALRFYTAAGSHISYSPDQTTLVNHWHMIVVTFDTITKERRLYWDGQIATSDSDPGEPTKTSEFTIGESPVFTGRFFDGRIEDVALWDHALTEGAVAEIYRSTQPVSNL